MEDFLDIVKGLKRIPVFVDLNNLLYRSFYVFVDSTFKTKSGIPNGHLFGFCQAMKTLDKSNFEIFLCEDSNCTWRKELNENYKANRHPEESGTEFWRDFQKIRDLISDLPHAHTLYAEGYEADDLMYSGAKICNSLGMISFIFSTDKDLLQALDTRTYIMHKVTLKGKEVVTKDCEYYTSKFPVEPAKLPYYRAFKGDSSDNLSAPVQRLPKDLTLDLVDYLYEHQSLAGYKIKKETHKKWLKQLCDNWDKYIRNLKIMRLSIIDFEVLKKSPMGSYLKVAQDYELYGFMKYINEVHTSIN